jgi:RimJ/RimL family protein N-acetyltransferase
VESALRERGHAEATAWTDDDVGARFAERHGFREARRKPVSVIRLDRTELPPLVIPDGVALVPLVDLADRLRELHELAMLAHSDDPADPLDAEQSFEEWLRDDLGVPDLDYQGSVVAVTDDRPAALAFVASDGHARAENEFTGTHPEYRGRGLATLAKLSTLHWARARGIREIWTGNDSENAPMLAINRKLGYQPAGSRRKHVKPLD